MPLSVPLAVPLNLDNHSTIEAASILTAIKSCSPETQRTFASELYGFLLGAKVGFPRFSVQFDKSFPQSFAVKTLVCPTHNLVFSTFFVFGFHWDPEAERYEISSDWLAVYGSNLDQTWELFCTAMYLHALKIDLGEESSVDELQFKIVCRNGSAN